MSSPFGHSTYSWSQSRSVDQSFQAIPRRVRPSRRSDWSRQQGEGSQKARAPRGTIPTHPAIIFDSSHSAIESARPDRYCGASSGFITGHLCAHTQSPRHRYSHWWTIDQISRLDRSDVKRILAERQSFRLSRNCRVHPPSIPFLLRRNTSATKYVTRGIPHDCNRRGNKAENNTK